MSTTRVLSQEEIGEVLTRCGLTWNPLLLERAEAYLVFLEKWNARINLTAMRDPLGVVEVLLAESFFGAQFAGNPAGPVLDIGSGAGFPDGDSGLSLGTGCDPAGTETKKSCFSYSDAAEAWTAERHGLESSCRRVLAERLPRAAGRTDDACCWLESAGGGTRLSAPGRRRPHCPFLQCSGRKGDDGESARCSLAEADRRSLEPCACGFGRRNLTVPRETVFIAGGQRRGRQVERRVPRGTVHYAVGRLDLSSQPQSARRDPHRVPKVAEFLESS